MDAKRRNIPEHFACPVCGTENSSGVLRKIDVTYYQLVTEERSENPLHNPTFFGAENIVCHNCGFVMQFHFPPGYE